MQIDIKAFALACAIVWGLGVFLGTWWIIAPDGSREGMPLLGGMYRGFTITPIGSVIGLLWATADGFVGGVVFAWLYNRLLGRTTTS